VAKRGAEAILKQILEDGFFHADPHPANLFIQPPADIVMLDVGMVGYLDRKTTAEGAKLLRAIVDRDTERTLDAFENLKIIVTDIDRSLFCQDLSELFDSYLGIPLKNLDIAMISQEVMEIAIRHNLTLPANLVLMVKALSMIEATGKSLYPELDILTIAKPFVRRISQNRINPHELLNKGEALLHDSIGLAEMLPRELTSILNKLQEGRLKLVTENRDLEKLAGAIGHAGRHLSLALIIAALGIGSVLIIIHQQASHFILGMPVLGFSGLLLALVLLLILVVSMLRSGKSHY
jgi:ubiquinone biosynthesis protein